MALRRGRRAPAACVSLPDMSAFDYLTLREDDTARRMVDPAVERFVAEDLGQGRRAVRHAARPTRPPT